MLSARLAVWNFRPNSGKTLSGLRHGQNGTYSQCDNVLSPVWLAAGFADYLCHRAADTEHTSGWRESLLASSPFLHDKLLDRSNLTFAGRVVHVP